MFPYLIFPDLPALQTSGEYALHFSTEVKYIPQTASHIGTESDTHALNYFCLLKFVFLFAFVLLEYGRFGAFTGITRPQVLLGVEIILFFLFCFLLVTLYWI